MEPICINIKKPLYGNYCYLNGATVEKAIRLGVKLEITIPSGKAVVDPLEWKKEGKIMKKVFKFANNPMVLYGGWVPVPYVDKKKGRIVKTKEEPLDIQQKLF